MTPFMIAEQLALKCFAVCVLVHFTSLKLAILGFPNWRDLGRTSAIEGTEFCGVGFWVWVLIFRLWRLLILAAKVVKEE